MEPNQPLETEDPDIQELISRWAGESKRLLIALPGVLAKLEDLQEDTGRLRERLADLERENLALRQSREELAETFAKLKALISGTAVSAAADVEAPRPRVTPPLPNAESTRADSEGEGRASAPAPPRERPAPVPPPAAPVPEVAAPPPPASAEPSPRGKPEEPAPAPSSSVRFSSVFRPPSKS